MHLRSLTLQAIGPFVTEHTIDFEALSASGLFLLDGPTGAGKSTLIDAVVFALYGKVASAAASEDRLRSDFATDDVESFVDLVFETGAGVFRVRRSPAYDRAKRRGTGTTRQNAQVVLWRLGPDASGPQPVGTVLSTRLDEVGLQLQGIVGLDRTQFVQTIVLPQGEFAQFLRADPEERRGLLQRIFGTQVYEQLQDELVRLRREVGSGVDDARGELGRAGERVLAAAGLGETEAAQLRELVAQDPSAGLEAAADRRDGLARAAADRATERSSAEDARAASRRRLDEAQGLRRALDRRDLLRAERSELAGRVDAVAADALVLDAARRARAVRPLVRGAADAATALAAAEKSLAAAHGLAPAELPAPGPDQDARGAWLADRDDAVSRAATLGRAAELEGGLDAARHRLRAERDDLDDLRTEESTLAAGLAARPGQRAALVEQIAQARAGAAEQGGCRERLAAAGAALDAARHATELAGQLAGARESLVAAVAAALAATTRETELRQARISGLAGELAGALEPGEPCPVCGGTEHPRKAPLDEDHVDAERVAAAEERARAAEQAAERERHRVTTLTERETAARDASGGLAVPDAEASVSGARDALAAAEQAETRRGRLEQAIADHDGATEERRVAHQQLTGRVAAAEAALLARQEELAKHEADVVRARGGHPTVAARRGGLLDRVDTVERVLEAWAQTDEARRDLDRRAAELAVGLAESAFVDPAAVEAATRPADEVDRLAAAVAAHASATERVEQGLAEPDVAALAEDATVDLEQAIADDAAAEQAVRAAAGAAQVADERSRAVEGAVARLADAAGVLHARTTQAGPVLRLAALAAGSGPDNPAALSLATYVLARRFEDVVAAANERLVVMSDGRYELTRSEVREDVRSRRTGLSMRVVDHRTASERDPRTLSGGETFYVSLCLALGMADVVTAEAGGIDLGTLFVDEGFGSLDPHTLDQVLLELGKLQAGGRVVGVVSHVEALKQTIADRIEVRRTPDGASTLRVLAG